MMTLRLKLRHGVAGRFHRPRLSTIMRSFIDNDNRATNKVHVNVKLCCGCVRCNIYTTVTALFVCLFVTYTTFVQLYKILLLDITLQR